MSLDNRKLIDRQPVVVTRIIEINEPDFVPNNPSFRIFVFNIDPIGKDLMEAVIIDVKKGGLMDSSQELTDGIFYSF